MHCPTRRASDRWAPSPRFVPRVGARRAAASGMRPRKAPTKGGRGCPSEGRGVVTSAHVDAAAKREERGAAVDGHTRTTPAVRDATPSLQLCTVLSAAMRGDRGDACRWLGGLRDGRLPRLHPLLRGSRKDELPRQVPRRHGARRAAIPAPHRRRSGRRSIFIPAAVKRGEPFFGTAVARQHAPQGDDDHRLAAGDHGSVRRGALPGAGAGAALRLQPVAQHAQV